MIKRRIVVKFKLISSILPVLVISFILVSCAAKQAKSPEVIKTAPVGIIAVDDYNFGTEVKEYDGAVILLFYNEKDWQSKDMKKRIEHFADKYSGRVKFCEFPWSPGADGEAYGLEMLPTVILYRNGAEIDRIKGIPPEDRDRLKWNDDIELWLLKNVLSVKAGKYSGNYIYMFKNSYRLNISNY